MDYRNSDGSVSEMCGNGVRAFAHFLIAEGLVELAEGHRLPVLTRAGLRSVRKVPEGYIAFVEELPGANTQGATLDDARANLEEAVAACGGVWSSN